MSTPKTSNPLAAASDFIVLDASAGSGKTYSLVQHILLNALRPKNLPEAYQKILAITFTNNAADEMKARLLNQLLEFTSLEKPSESDFFKPIWEELKISPAELQQRAKAAANHMLHNYSTLQVGTIDQFTHRLVRTFTRDLQLTDNFEIRLDLEAMVAEALDLLYSTLGDQPELRDSLVDLIQERMNRDKSHNPDRTLRKEGLKSFDEATLQEVKNLPKPERMLEISKSLDEEIGRIVEEGRNWSQKCVEFLRSNGLDLTDFTYKDQIHKHFLTFWHNLRRNDLEAGKQALTSRLKEGPVDEWAALRDAMGEWQAKHQRKLLMLKQATAKLQQLAATRALLDQLSALQEAQNTMPLGAFNKLISDELQKEPTAFIYARLGERFWHFYIDEFQDTSNMQFNNLHPLIEHTLTKDERKNSALIVGDAKQSIYRWRGGRAEQFISLVDGSNPLNRFNADPTAPEMYSRETVQLDCNFRTYPTIVRFNNDFFPMLANSLTEPAHKWVYSKELVGQHPKVGEESQGEVRVDFLYLPEGEKHSAAKHAENVFEHTLARIKELQERGHSLSDIALLVRSNKNTKLLANFLVQHDIPVLSADSLVVGASFESKILLAAAKLHLNAKDRDSLFELAFALTKLGKGPADIEAFTFQKNCVDGGLAYLQEVFPGAKKIKFAQQSLYQFGTQVFQTFGLLSSSNAMVDASLDLLFQFQSMGGALSDLPAWWDVESKKRNVSAGEDLAAVQIMTIHKSKGLEFEHVIVPFGIDEKNRDAEYWVPFDLHNELQRIPITKSEKTEKLFPEEQLSAIKNEETFDWINLIYVTLTRPVRGLHIFADGEKPDAFGKALREHFELGEGQHTVSIGTPVPPEHEEATEKSAAPRFNSDGVQARMSHLMLADTAPAHWFEGKADPRQWGSALHRVLQHSSAQQGRALERLYRSGKFSEALHEEAEAVLQNMEDRKELGPIQQSSTIVYVERTVANKTKVLRPDLIMSTESEVRIVDYKTGQEKPAHQKQVEEYAEALGNVFASVETSIVYL